MKLTQKDFENMLNDAARTSAWQNEVLAEMISSGAIEEAHTEALRKNAVIDALSSRRYPQFTPTEILINSAKKYAKDLRNYNHFNQRPMHAVIKEFNSAARRAGRRDVLIWGEFTRRNALAQVFEEIAAYLGNNIQAG